MKDHEDNQTSDSHGKLDPKDIIRLALDTRNLEINLFWQRSNYFLVLNTALAVGFFNAKSKLDACILAAIGFVVALLWYRVNLGSKYWYSSWEQRLKVVEKEYAPGLNLFSADWPVIQDDVRKCLNIDDHHGVRRMLDKQVLRKPSVSVAMIMLSLVFLIGWVALLLLKMLVKPI